MGSLIAATALFAVPGLAMASSGEGTCDVHRVGVADLYEDPDPDPQLILWTKRSRTVVDRGRIEPRSIRLRPTALLWKRDGTQMRAALHRCRPLGA